MTEIDHDQIAYARKNLDRFNRELAEYQVRAVKAQAALRDARPFSHQRAVARRSLRDARLAVADFQAIRDEQLAYVAALEGDPATRE